MWTANLNRWDGVFAFWPANIREVVEFEYDQ